MTIDTLVKWIETLPFDTAKAIFDANADVIGAASETHPEHYGAVQAAWMTRNEVTP